MSRPEILENDCEHVRGCGPCRRISERAHEAGTSVQRWASAIEELAKIAPVNEPARMQTVLDAVGGLSFAIWTAAETDIVGEAFAPKVLAPTRLAS